MIFLLYNNDKIKGAMTGLVDSEIKVYLLRYKERKATDINKVIDC